MVAKLKNAEALGPFAIPAGNAARLYGTATLRVRSMCNLYSVMAEIGHSQIQNRPLSEIPHIPGKAH
jgi:hypothetical protein